MNDSPNEEQIKVFLTTTLAPILGVFTSELLAFGPLGAILECRKCNSLETVNPLVFPLLFGNSIGWVVYSSSTRNPYVFGGNVGGVLLALFYLLSSHSLSNSDGMKRTLEFMAMFLAGLWSAVGFAAAMMDDKVMAVNMIGTLANIVVFLLYASPLSTFYTVISIKDSSSINRPFAVCQVINCALWSAYGLAIGDIYVSLPNIAGLALGVAQVFLIVIFPIRAPPSSLSESLVKEQDAATNYETFPSAV